MCLVKTIERNTKENEKIVYKVFLFLPDRSSKVEDCCLTPFHTINGLKSENDDNRTLSQIIRTKSNLPGYHCFRSYKTARTYVSRLNKSNPNFRVRNYVIASFKIPKHTEYISGQIGVPYIGSVLPAITTRILKNAVIIKHISFVEKGSRYLLVKGEC
jgi:hypothetical protein